LLPAKRGLKHTASVVSSAAASWGQQNSASDGQPGRATQSTGRHHYAMAGEQDLLRVRIYVH
jgi:hypothetical protein